MAQSRTKPCKSDYFESAKIHASPTLSALFTGDELWALGNHDPFVLERVQELYTRARRSLLEIIEELRPDLATQDREDLALFISASMEGLTVFAGYEKPFEKRMDQLEAIAIQSFLRIVATYRIE